MNLHAIVRPAIGAINPDLLGSVLVCTGYTTAANGRQQPTYTRTDGVPMQIQALSSKEVEHLDSLNIQNVTRAVYINGNIEGIDRVLLKGGDLLVFLGETWLVTTTLETWDVGGWCKVAVTKQTDGAI